MTVWGLTSFFDPLGGGVRLANHRAFRAALDVPLLAVEWSPRGDFVLGPDDADRIVRVAGGDLMWQKERLLALGLERLPDEADVVAWLDDDVLFDDPDWPARAERALARARAVQLFSEARYLDADGRPQGDPVAASARIVAERGADALVDADLAGQARAPGGPFRLPRNPGLAWAARRADLAAVGFFERAIVGSGDLLFLFAALGRAARWLDGARPHGYGYLARSRFPEWADRVHAHLRGEVACLDGGVRHLYHGDLASRAYKRRHRALDALGLDVERDVVAPPGAALRFARRDPRWTSFMAAYFAARDRQAAAR